MFDQGNERARFVHANAKHPVPLEPAEKVDVVLAVGALHHMTSLDEVFSAMKRYVAPGTAFFAIEPSAGNPFVHGLRSLRAKLDAEYSAEQHYFKDDELRDLLARNGLRDIEVTHQGYFTPPFAQVILRPQSLFVLLANVAVVLDRLIDKHFNVLLSPLSWNVFVRARFP